MRDENTEPEAKGVPCPKCGGSAIFKSRGHIYEVTCPSCHYSESGTCYPGDEAGRISNLDTTIP